MNQPLEEYTPPDNPLWVPFVKAVRKRTLEWEVLRRAVDEGWGDSFHPKYSEERIVHDMLINFADAWKSNSDVKAVSISEFFNGFFEDFFNADLEGGGYPLAIVLSKVFYECRTGKTTGLEYILGPDWHKNEEQIAVENQSVSEISDMMVDTMRISEQSTQPNADKAVSAEDDDIMDAGESNSTSKEQQNEDQIQEDNGWAVAGRGRRGRNRNKNRSVDGNGTRELR
uniref:Pre-rRNA-processing protein TSR2 homolog n=1 Tax=Aplanochytrium stocchinoi TaxID=215587 RepID=A0A7S3PP84_9STRA|mmetsp:Transcript_9775/g.11240  ORF Transcript_9775/g.11240 Transcript_9775/m.11240 type:complete len:227 (+) Transcript_9775:328-1008(+)